MTTPVVRMRLQDHVVIVTGGASGIGAATARRVTTEGATVVIFDINREAAEKHAATLCSEGADAAGFGVDVTRRSDWEAAVSRVIEQYGRIDALVNNAGVTRDKSLVKMSDDDWDLVIDVNLKGAWLGCQAVAPHLRERGGSIVNMSSESRNGEFGQSNYSAAKAGVVGLTRTVAIEQARYNVRCNAIAPGSVDTPMTRVVPEQVRDSWLDSIPLRRLAEPDEIASVVAFLLSADAAYVTGQVVGVDGGSSR
jgi:3-oxoacyl-[acyl-carrier protein] reductase